MTSTHLANLAKIGQLDPVPPGVGAHPANSCRCSAAIEGLHAGTGQQRDAIRLRIQRHQGRRRHRLADERLQTVHQHKPGHHQAAIQALVHTLAVDVQTVRILDGLRRLRSGSNYEGDTVNDAALAECLRQSSSLLAKLEAAISKPAKPDTRQNRKAP